MSQVSKIRLEILVIQVLMVWFYYYEVNLPDTMIKCPNQRKKLRKILDEREGVTWGNWKEECSSERLEVIYGLQVKDTWMLEER